jgi:CRP-like cAMP-binding protein
MSARDSLSQTMDLMGAAMAYPRNSEIFGEGEPADYLYKVISGSVRTYKITRDGRRQVGGFYMPGDIFGLEFAHDHTLSAEAIGDTQVLVVKRTALNSLAGDWGILAPLGGTQLRNLNVCVTSSIAVTIANARRAALQEVRRVSSPPE